MKIRMKQLQGELIKKKYKQILYNSFQVLS